MTTRIVAIDPGGLTGVAWRDTSGGIYTIALPGYYPSDVDDCKDAFDWVSQFDWNVIICERFTPRQRQFSSDGLNTIELYGQFKGLARYIGAAFVSHTPAMRVAWQRPAELFEVHSLSSPKALHKARGVRIGRTVHEEDALAHLLMYLEIGEKQVVR